MKRNYGILLLSFIIFIAVGNAQVFLNDFPANDFENNSNGVWRPRISAAANGTFSIAWEDYSDRPGVNSNTTGRSQIAVRRFSSEGEPLEQIHFFRGESTTLSMWMFDYLEHAELEYLANGVLLILMQHTGRLVIGGDDIGSSEVTLGAINPNGQIIKLHNFGDNVQSPLIFTSSRRQDRPRLSITPDNLIVAILDESSYDSDFRNVAFRALNTDLDDVLTREIPHDDGVGNAPHINADVANNGNLFATVWQDGRYANFWSISTQFYTGEGPVGTNHRVNDTEPGAAFALWPSVSMNSSGKSVVVFIDSRNGIQIFGQLFDTDANTVGGNFQVSETPVGGDIYSRPEVAIREDGSFMVVWTDSTAVPGAFRAKARQFDTNGNPLGPPFILPAQDVVSGYPDIATDGSAYYCTWLDNRLDQAYPNIYASKLGTIISSTNTYQPGIPISIRLYPAYPNPFNPVTTIRFTLPRQMHTSLEIFDLLGRKIATLVDEELSAGEYERVFNAEGVTSGIYFFQLRAENYVETRRSILLK